VVADIDYEGTEKGTGKLDLDQESRGLKKRYGCNTSPRMILFTWISILIKYSKLKRFFQELNILEIIRKIAKSFDERGKNYS
jgi:hypothetical protein